MVHVWYVQYGEIAGQIDPAEIYTSVLAEIKTEDPDAYIEEIRQYTHQIAFYVNHPTWTEATLRKETFVVVTTIIIIGILIAAILTAAGAVITAWLNYEKEHRWYADKDPDTGEEVMIYGWDKYLLWLAEHKPAELQALKDYGATNWFEQIMDWLPIILFLIGTAIFVPVIMRFIPGKEGG